MDLLDKLRIKDIKILANMTNCESIRELARFLNSDPQNLNKRIKSIENTLGFKVLDRSGQGVVLNTYGRKVSALANLALENITEMAYSPNSIDQKRLRVSGRAFLVDYFIDFKLPLLHQSLEDVKFDLIDQSPEQTERACRKGLIDIALSFDDIILGPNWEKHLLRKVTWKLFEHKSHHCSQGSQDNQTNSSDEIIGFCYVENNNLISQPSPFQKKYNLQRSHGVVSTHFAKKATKSLGVKALLPDISLSKEGDSELREVTSFQEESKDLFLHINIDTISSSIKSLLLTKE